jgi:hypothetical protein
MSIHGLAFVNPLILSKLCAERALLQPLHLHGKSWTQLLQPRSVLVFLLTIDIAVVSDKYEISLIMKRDNLPPFQLRILHNNVRKRTILSPHARSHLWKE